MEGEECNSIRKKQKTTETLIREPYEIRSRKVAETSFAKFTESKQQVKEYEFPKAEYH